MNNEDKFSIFLAEREMKNDWSLFISPDGSRIVRKLVCNSCKFTRSTIYQNKAIQNRLIDIEKKLMERGIIKIINPVIKERIKNQQHMYKSEDIEMELLDKRLTAFNEYLKIIEFQFDSTMNEAEAFPLPKEK